MMWLRQLRQLYSLDTLDTRFTTSSKTPPPDATTLRSDLPDPAKGTSQGSSTRHGNGVSTKATGSVDQTPSQWRTPEFLFYYVFLCFAIPLMFKVAHDVSKESHPNYQKYSHLLSPGWIAGRKVDNSDLQYAGFRDNIPYLCLLLLLHPSLRRLYNYLFLSTSASRTQPPSPSYSNGKNERSHPLQSAAVGGARLEQRVTYDFGFAILFICALHGISAFKIILILYINYQLATRLPRSQVPIATWTFGIGILFANELCGGYQLAGISRLVLPSPASSEKDFGDRALSGGFGAWLDGFGGLMPRWEVFFKMTVLRMISFNYDYIWSLTQSGGSPIEVRQISTVLCTTLQQHTDIHKKKQLDPAKLSERDRLGTPAKPHEYSFRNYIAYSLYCPLYLAGPIVTFNDYISQLHYPASSITTGRTVRYGIRFVLTLLCMEMVLHYIYAVAISKAQPTWEVYTPFQVSMLGYFNLHIIWLKLLLPWRFFRLWALIDGVDPPENMVRCMSDNYSALAFWRGWHRSFNRWIVRYIYVPLGGSDPSGGRGTMGKVRAVVNFLIVFTFVALWHDIQLRLLMWGWLVSLFVLPEVLATILFPKRKWRGHPTAYRMICGVGAVGNILMMMAANLVGFALGLDGLKGLVHGIVGSYSGLVFLVTACGALFVGVQVMFEIREHEMRQGIKLKC